MSKNTPALAAPSEAAASLDLSSEIAAMVEREPGDQVRCRNVGGNRYRCNWWSTPKGTADRGGPRGLESTELRVRKSRLLEVTKSGDRLQIGELAGRPQ
jgi:hypothetical protein